MIKKLSFKTLSLFVAFAVIISGLALVVSPVMAEDVNAIELMSFDKLTVNKGSGNQIKETASTVQIGDKTVNGFKINADALNETPADKLTATKSPLVLSFNPVPLNNLTQMVFYVKVPEANLINFTLGVDANYYMYSWSPTLYNNEGLKYKVLEKGSDKWVEKTFVTGDKDTKLYGSVQFDGAFEGYIMFELENMTETNFVLLREIDKIGQIALRFQKFGGSYGEIEIAPLMAVADNGSTDFAVKYTDTELTKTDDTYKPSYDIADREGIKKYTVIHSNREFSHSKYPINIQEVNNLDFTTEPGYILSLDEPLHIENPETLNSSNRYINLVLDSEHSMKDTTGIVFKISVPSETTIYPYLSVKNPGPDRWKYQSWGDPALTALQGADYWILPDDATEWETRPFVSAREGSKYFGAFYFEDAFEGYIKIPYESLASDSGFKFDASLDSLSGFTLRMQDLGPDFKIEMSALMLSKQLANANRDDIKTFAPLQVERNAGPNVNRTPVTPLDFTTEQGYMISKSSDHNISTEDTYKTGVYLQTIFKAGQSLKGTDGLLIYVSVPGETVIAPTFNAKDPGDTTRWKYPQWGDPELSPTVGAAYDALRDGSSNWESLQFIQTRTDSSYKAGIYFKSAFSGFIKIPYSSLKNDSGFKFDAELDTLSGAAFRFRDLGPTFGEITVAPILLTKPVEVKHGDYPVTDPMEQVKYLLNGSKKKLVKDVNYFMVGDSTRAGFGSVVYRRVKYVMENEYNVTTHLQAMSGLKAEHWSGYTPNLQGDKQPTVEQLIEKIPDDGYNCIVDISLGINDTDNHSGAKTAEMIEMGINKIKAAKPYAVIVYTTPNLVGQSAWQKKLDENNDIFRGKTDKYAIIDVAKNAMDKYISSYYMDFIHPNTAGQRAIGEYIISVYFPEHPYNKPIPPKDYELSNPWKLSDLPEFTPYSAISGTKSYSALTSSLPDSPVPTLSTFNGAKIESNTGCDYDKESVHKSIHWLSTTYDSFPINDGTHLMFYLKVPKAKDNYLVFSLFGADHYEFKGMGQSPYSLMSVGSNEWEHYVTVDGPLTGFGSFYFPAGFEGLVKIPYTSLTPLKIDSNTVVTDVTYRFSYIGNDEDGTILIGPLLNVTKDNDEGPGALVLTRMPAATTTRYIYKPDKTDIFKDKVMLYWQSLTGALDYVITAYKIDETEEGYTYTQTSTATVYSNSGTIGGLEPGTKYAINVQARGDKKTLLAIYDFITVTTIDGDLYDFIGASSDIVNDSVYYRGANASGVDISVTTNYLPLIIILSCIGVAVATGAVALVVVLKKRKEKKI